MIKKERIKKISIPRRRPKKRVEKIPTRYVFIILIAVLFLTLTAFYLFFPPEKTEEIFTCGDGSFYNTCSLKKPYFCQEGELVERASVCGCDELSVKQGNSCISNYHLEPKSIALRYNLEGKTNEINFIVYKNANDYVSNISRVIYYSDSEVPFRSDFKHKSINDEVQESMILPLIKKIQNIAPDDSIEQVRIAVSLVQNIPYGFSGKVISFEGGEVNYSRYPYEVLYDNQGICGEKSALLALLLKEIGYGVSIFYFADENHEAVGIKCPKEKSLYGSGYCFVETGGPSIITDTSIEFEGGIKLKSKPEIILISEGIPLPDNIYEYKDAEILMNIRKRNLLGLIKFWKLDDIREKYNLDKIYNLR